MLQLSLCLSNICFSQDADTPEVKACFTALGDFKIETWIRGMDYETIERFYAVLIDIPKTGMVQSFTRPFLPFIKPIEQLQV